MTVNQLAAEYGRRIAAFELQKRVQAKVDRFVLRLVKQSYDNVLTCAELNRMAARMYGEEMQKIDEKAIEKFLREDRKCNGVNDDL